MRGPSNVAQAHQNREPYRRVVANLFAVLATLAAIGVECWRHSQPLNLPAPSVPKVEAARKEAPALLPVARLAPEPEPAPKLDREAVAQAEAEVAAAHRERIRADERARSAVAALEATTRESASAALAARSISARVRDPSVRIARASERSAQYQVERGRLQDDLAGLARAPRPKRKSLIDRTPVARPAEGSEFHFEIRHNRVTFIDVERLLERVKADARLRIRLREDHRPIVSSVAPVGAFSMRYELERSLPAAIEDMLEMRGTTYILRSWEIVPESEGRGEPFEMAFRPASDFARTINRLNPARATITMWVYPDGFALYHKLRDALHERGFLVAARPLPEGMAIRGSPAGSLSAGQ